MSDFLPEGYKEPETSNYMSFEEGENTFRILGKFTDGKAVMGQEYWKTVDGKRKPFRVSPEAKVCVEELEIDPRTGDLDMPKFFWALPVWNYSAKRIQILKINQKSIRKDIQKLVDNPKWGDPTEYDIVVNQAKEGKKTSYSTFANPKEKIDGEVKKTYEAMTIDWQAYMESKDPFSNGAEDLAEEVSKKT